MSTQLTASGGEELPRRSTTGGGLFALYKPGQGYWTRLGSALGAGAIVLFVAWFVFNETSVFPALQSSGRRYGLAAAVVAVLAVVVWWAMNGPRRAQFMIDTDSELKKVSWASWPELIGSTRIVVFFMLLTALMLFTFDTQFHALFFTLRVWHITFAGLAGIATGVVLATVLIGSGVGLLRGGAEATKRSRFAGMASLVAGILVLVAWIGYGVTHPDLFKAPSPVNSVVPTATT